MDFQAMLREERAAAKAKAATTAAPAAPAATSLAMASAAASSLPSTLSTAFLPLALSSLSGAARLARDGVPRPLTPTQLGEVRYVADFVTATEEAHLLAQTHCAAARWTQLRSRRLQSYAGDELPPWLRLLARALVAAGIFPPTMMPDHALLNEYAPGEGILAHTDGPCYEPLVACLSLQSSALLSFRERLRTEEVGSRAPRTLAQLVLRPRSLVVFSGDAYQRALHEIAPVAHETVGAAVANLAAAHSQPGELIVRGPRVSITLRKSRPPNPNPNPPPPAPATATT